MLVRREPEGPFNKAPVVRAVSAFLLVVAVLATLTRVVTKLILVRRCKTDDNLIIAAAVCFLFFPYLWPSNYTDNFWEYYR